jgi:hypothetical protein
MSDATFAVDNAVPILSNAIFMQNLFAMLAFNYAIYFTLPLITQSKQGLGEIVSAAVYLGFRVGDVRVIG